MFRVREISVGEINEVNEKKENYKKIKPKKEMTTEQANAIVYEIWMSLIASEAE